MSSLSRAGRPDEEIAECEFPGWGMRYSLVEQPVENALKAVREAGVPRADTLDRIAAFVGLNRRGR